MRYHMESPTRAKAVAKDMKGLLADIGIVEPLGRCQSAVARMYGYRDWRHMLTEMNLSRKSREDVEVTGAEADARRAMQRNVAAELGVPNDRVEDFLTRLSPTGRSEGDVQAAMTVVPTQWSGHYHPIRLFEMLSSNERLCREADAKAQALKRHFEAQGSDAWRVYSPSEHVTDAYEKWVAEEEVELSPLDRMLVNARMFEHLYHYADGVVRNTGFVIDAEAVAEEMSKKDVSRDRYGTGPKPEPKNGRYPAGRYYYVHFGINRFPSPFPGCGVEGCYVALNGFGPDRIDIIPVVSPELPYEGTWGVFDYAMRTPFFHQLKDTIRFVTTGADNDVHNRIGDALRAENCGYEYPDEYAETWVPFLPPIVNAAWNAFRAFENPAFPKSFGASADLTDEWIRKLQRARTDAQRTRVMVDLTTGGDTVAVFLGDPKNTMAVEAELEFANRPPPYAPGMAYGNPAEWAESYLRTCTDSFGNEEALSMKALMFAGIAWEREPQKKNRELLRRATALRIDILYDAEKFEEAMALIAAMEETEDSYGCWAIGACIAARGRDPKRIRRAMIDASKREGVLADWIRAILYAASDDISADQMLDRAVDAGVLVAEKLVEDDFRTPAALRWLIERQDPPGRIREAEVVAAMISTAWRALDGGTRIDAALDRRRKRAHLA